MTFLRTLSFRTAAAAVAALVVGVSSAKADTVIDDFSEPSPAVIYSITGTGTSPFTAPTQVVANGGVRTTTVVATSTVGLVSDSVTGVLGGGFFRVASNDNSAAIPTITYSYATPLDLTGVTSFGVNVVAIDSGLGVTSTALALSVTTSTGTLSINTTIVDGVNTFYSYDLSAFSGSGDLSSVSAVSLVLNDSATPNVASDFRIDSLSFVVVPPTNAVPAPPALFLALAAAPIFGLRRVLRKKSA